jgi:hypothetical protein
LSCLRAQQPAARLPGDNVIPRLRSRRWQPPGMSAAAANDRSLRRWVEKRHRNHRNEPAGKTTIRLSDPTGSSDSSGFSGSASGQCGAWRITCRLWFGASIGTNRIQTQVTYGYMYPVHRDPSGHYGRSAPRPPSAAPPTPRNPVIASTDARSGLQRRGSNAFTGRNANTPS